MQHEQQNLYFLPDVMVTEWRWLQTTGEVLWTQSLTFRCYTNRRLASPPAYVASVTVTSGWYI